MPIRPPTYRPPGAPSAQDHAQAYDRRRGTPHSRGYTHKLRKAMDAWKHRNPLCLGCQAVERISATEVTDHIIPHKGDKLLLWNAANWQPACREHHDIIKQRLEDMVAKGKASASDLRLDSELAKQLTRELLQ